jgi:hypothetical protein
VNIKHNSILNAERGRHAKPLQSGIPTVRHNIINQQKNPQSPHLRIGGEETLRSEAVQKSRPEYRNRISL